MIKEIKGVKHMTGTSEGSLIPAVAWDDVTGFHLGVRPEVAVADDKKKIQVAFFARVQFFDAEGTDVEFVYKTASKFLKHVELRFAGPYHASGMLTSLVFGTPDGSDIAADDIILPVQTMYRQIASAFAKQHKIWRLSDDTLDAIIVDALKGVLGAEKPAEKAPPAKSPVVLDKEEDAKLDQLFKEDNLDADFDWTKMIGKPKGDASPKE